MKKKQEGHRPGAGSGLKAARMNPVNAVKGDCEPPLRSETSHGSPVPLTKAQAALPGL